MPVNMSWLDTRFRVNRRNIIVLTCFLVAILLSLALHGQLTGVFTSSAHHGHLFSLSSVTDSETQRQIPDVSGRKKVNVMIFARKRSGSSVTGSYIGENPDFFYFYEPGRIVSSFASGIGGENFEFLEEFRPRLLGCLDAFYSCNFTLHEYIISKMNEDPIYRTKGKLHLNPPFDTKDLTNLCRSRKNAVAKVLRLYNLLLAAPLLQKHNVKVIHLVRDPRGVIKSRELFRKPSRATAKEGELLLSGRLKTEIADYCRWLETNYIISLHGPQWLRKNYMLVRYEDIVNRPLEVASQMYTFIGTSADEFIRRNIVKASLKKTGNAEAWRRGVTFSNVQQMQDLCPERVWAMFGYRLVDSARMLYDNTTSLVGELPAIGADHFGEVYFNEKYTK